MPKVQWVKWKDGGGPRVRGSVEYDSPTPYGIWTKILGVVARCEGNHDTVVMYDETGVTWGFMQWTFTSGRLQKLLQSFKAISLCRFDLDADDYDDPMHTLWDEVCINQDGSQVFAEYGFIVQNGRFVDITQPGKRVPLNPAVQSQKKRIADICMGRVQYQRIADQKRHAMGLAELFSNMAQGADVAIAQIAYAKQEFKQQMTYKRKPLDGSWLAVPTIGCLLQDAWDTPLAALFFNLWQNNPGAAYKLFLQAGKGIKNPDEFFSSAWFRANRSKFGNWGWGKTSNKQPRVIRIKDAMKEFYGIDLPYFKS